MAIDTQAVIEALVSQPASITNAAGETVSFRSTDDILKAIDALPKTRKRPPFKVTLGIPPGTVGPNPE